MRAAVEERIGIVHFAVLGPGQPDQHAGPPSARLAGEPLAGRAAGVLKGRLEHQILGRVTGEEQLGEHDEIGAERAASARAARALSSLPATSPTMGLSWASASLSSFWAMGGI